MVFTVDTGRDSGSTLWAYSWLQILGEMLAPLTVSGADSGRGREFGPCLGYKR